VKFYFTQTEYDSVNTRISDLGGTPLTGMDQLWFYKVTNAGLGQFPAIPSITVDDVRVIYNGIQAAPDEWILATKTAGNEFIAEYEVASFSGGGGGGASGGESPLPVELVYFEVFAVEDNVQLKWSTATEINNRGFEIQRSQDGVNWEVLGFEEGKGNSVNLERYQFVDRNPYRRMNYYRLKQIDFDGKAELLPIRSVNMKSYRRLVKAYPNPTTQYLSILNAKGSATIYNSSGQRVKEFDLDEGGVSVIDLGQYQDGIYHIALQKENGERVIKRVVKISNL